MDVATLVRLPERVYFRQLFFCRRIYEVDGTSACNSARSPPVETTRPRTQTIPQSLQLLVSPYPLEAERNVRPISRSCSLSMMARRLSWS